jgi:hypothetical protein
MDMNSDTVALGMVVVLWVAFFIGMFMVIKAERADHQE